MKTFREYLNEGIFDTFKKRKELSELKKKIKTEWEEKCYSWDLNRMDDIIELLKKYEKMLKETYKEIPQKETDFVVETRREVLEAIRKFEESYSHNPGVIDFVRKHKEDIFKGIV